MAHSVRARNIKKLKAFGQNLQEIRMSKGLSQEDLAHQANIAYTSINKIEKGELNTSVATVFEIAKALGIPPGKLFDF